MVYLVSGIIIFSLGLVYLIRPAKSPHSICSYSSLLATASPQGFYYAQRWCRNALLTIGFVELILGTLVNYFNLNHYANFWLLTIVASIALVFVHTESKLKYYLMRMGQLPVSYVAIKK